MATCGLMPLRVPTAWTGHDARPSAPICSACPCSLHARADHFHPTSVKSRAQPTKTPGRARARARKKLAYIASHASRLPRAFQKRKNHARTLKKRKTTRGHSQSQLKKPDSPRQAAKKLHTYCAPSGATASAENPAHTFLLSSLTAASRLLHKNFILFEQTLL